MSRMPICMLCILLQRARHQLARIQLTRHQVLRSKLSTVHGPRMLTGRLAIWALAREERTSWNGVISATQRGLKLV